MTTIGGSTPLLDAALAPLTDLGRADAVARRITEAIALGLVAAGDQLPSENDLADQLGVANGTVREALALLREAGLIETRRGRNGGSFVRTPVEDTAHLRLARLRDLATADLRDLGDEELAVFGTAARLAAERAASADLGPRLTRLVHELREATGPAERCRADARFHIELAVAAQSVRLTRLAVRLQAELGPLLWLPAPYGPDQERFAEQHQEILVAVLAGDAAGARVAAETHAVAGVHQLVRGHLELAEVG
ncbi:GntR family transcriptional regulator [Kitasatospora xanthocidica]|uniref:FadR/GntR family transcriptional regulator n=1 Tax=Kitasatospora xanthocidica TaxID=83382 RepID=UPI00198FAD14|nr:FCD domain-containing protein [Kitasatospora xanthocidica]GHF55518.1 GntR family transcriptional regulator [Kitasatospora xanthocidica]